MFSGPEIINNYQLDIKTNLISTYIATLSEDEATDTSCAGTKTYLPRAKVLDATARVMQLNPSSAESTRDKFINSHNVFQQNFLTDVDLNGRGGRTAFHVRRYSLLRRFVS
jgi:hypothetical protein